MIAFVACIAVASAAGVASSASADAQAETLRSESVVNTDSYQYSYETSNGIKAQSAGQLKPVDKESAIVQQGEYSYRAPDGQEIKITYIADENGYQATGDAIPQPPAIPEPIRRALEYLAEHAPPQKQ